MGAAAADYDNDGHVRTCSSPASIATFCIAIAATAHSRMSRRKRGSRAVTGPWPAGWFDYDNDGRLDLFVVHYSDGSACRTAFAATASTQHSRSTATRSISIRLPTTLYHNRGDGTFEDVSEKSGIAAVCGRGMSVAFADYDGDGFMDIFVTNDNMPNFLFHNRGNGNVRGRRRCWPASRCRDRGQPVSSMGADFRDYDNDGLARHCGDGACRRDLSAFPQRGQGHVRLMPLMRASIGPLSNWPQRLGQSDSSISTTTAGRTCSPPTRT